MQVITVDKVELLTVLRQNCQEHIAEWEEADDSYQKSLIEWYKDQILNVEEGEEFETWYQDVEQPVNHSADYDSIIEMLEFGEDEKVSLDQNEFKRFIKNEWPWAQAFTASSVYYNTKVGKFPE